MLTGRKRYDPPSESDYKDLTEAPTCPICLEIPIEPLWMPCGCGIGAQTMCQKCFMENYESYGSTCPTCREKINASTIRHRGGYKKLVNEALWNLLQRKFPSLIEARKRGEQTSVEPVHHDFAKPGDIRKWYEDEIAKDQETRRDEIDKRAQECEEKTLQMLKASGLQIDDLRKQADMMKRIQRDHALAQKLQREEENHKQVSAERISKDRQLAMDLEREEANTRRKRQRVDEEIARKLQQVTNEAENDEAKQRELEDNHLALRLTKQEMDRARARSQHRIENTKKSTSSRFASSSSSKKTIELSNNMKGGPHSPGSDVTAIPNSSISTSSSSSSSSSSCAINVSL